MLSLKNNFLFIHVPKTGGNSIQLILEKYSDDKIINADETMDKFGIMNDIYPIEKHSPLSLYRSLLDIDVYNSLYKFCVIRNPWEMVISYYFYFTNNYNDFKANPVRSNFWSERLFMEVVNLYIKPLRYFICTNNGKIDDEMDFIIKYENIENEFYYVLDGLKIPREPLQHKNKTQHRHYTEYYTKRLKSIIYEKFKEEIDFFDFKFIN